MLNLSKNRRSNCLFVDRIDKGVRYSRTHAPPPWRADLARKRIGDISPSVVAVHASGSSHASRLCVICGFLSLCECPLDPVERNMASCRLFGALARRAHANTTLVTRAGDYVYVIRLETFRRRRNRSWIRAWKRSISGSILGAISVVAWPGRPAVSERRIRSRRPPDVWDRT